MRPVLVDIDAIDIFAIHIAAYVVSALKAPENQAVMTSCLADGMQGGNEMFATYSADITKEFETMTVDETIEWLEKHKGMKLLETRHRNRAGEIDLIMLDGETVAFIEVKTRLYPTVL